MRKIPIVQTVNGKRVEIGTVEVNNDGTVFDTFGIDAIVVDEVPGLKEILKPDMSHYSTRAPEFQPLQKRIPGQFTALFQKSEHQE